ncbi:MAG: hypothetical protein ACRETL_03500, partial [Gammaproteobacteria bacterium]
MKTLALISVLLIAAATTLWAGEAPQPAPYVSGLGEFMTLTQLRHAKLWFAGDADNWELAAYELDEIKEGLEDAARLYPTVNDIPVGAMIKQNLNGPFADLERAIESKDGGNFRRSFDQLTDACNTCHAGAAHAFIRIQRPT